MLQKVLASTQDAALQRIEKLRNDRTALRQQLKHSPDKERLVKLEALLARCKATIKTNNEKIAALTNEMDGMKKTAGEHGWSSEILRRISKL